MSRLIIYISCSFMLLCVVSGQGVESMRDFSIPMAIDSDAPPSDLRHSLFHNSAVPGTPAGNKLEQQQQQDALPQPNQQQSGFNVPENMVFIDGELNDEEPTNLGFDVPENVVFIDGELDNEEPSNLGFDVPENIVFRDGELDDEEPSNLGFADFDFVSDGEPNASLGMLGSEEEAAERAALEEPAGRSSDANTATRRYSQLIDASDQELVKLLLCDNELVSLIDLLMAALNTRRSSYLASVDVCRAPDAVQRVKAQLLQAKWSAEVALLQRVQSAIEQVQNVKDNGDEDA